MADTSGIIAAYDADAREHEQARTLLAAGTAVISPLVLDEVDHLLVARFGGRTKGRRVADLVIDDLTDPDHRDRYLVPPVTAEDIRRARSVGNQYADLRLDLADAVNVVLADRYLTDTLLSLDQRGYRSIEPLTEGMKAFRLLPADL
ncbi:MULTISPECIES: type II toxin-antitoxin system VapC family toxin [unclassified Streptomyces]|uniref:type II toxin-antitoxin system VapC family toxin n=1 Tax=unclassified Streptomyces TaxID=2593676 RepID=UPI00278BD11C|nr:MULTISPECIES: PIN domain-containing protein [unclassified Streptomyces]